MTDKKSFKKRYGQKIEKLHEKGFLQKIAFFLSAKDKERNLSEEFKLFPEIGIMNFGYQFDDFIYNYPPESDINFFVSKKTFPYRMFY